MALDGLDMTRSGAVALIALDRPGAHNAITPVVSRALLEAATLCDRDHDVRAVLLRAGGPNFCVGGDVHAFAGDDASRPRIPADDIALFHAAVSKLARLPKPVVVAVQGHAAGAGFGLAMLGDAVIAARSARFSSAYTAIGLTPDGGATWLLPRLVGIRRTQQLLFENVSLGADEALAEGLVTAVVDDERLFDSALETATRLAAGPTAAFGRIKRLLLQTFREDLEAQLDNEARAIVASGETDDVREGVAAFLRKTPPRFVGR